MRLKIDVKGLKALKNISKLAAKAAKLAGNRALKQMKTAAVKEVRAKKAMKAGQLNKSAFLTIPARGNNLSQMNWSLLISGKPQPVSAYAVRQTKTGVTAKINKGKTSYLKHAFLAAVNGHLGVFFRKGDARLPITQAFTTTVADVFRDDDGTALRVQEVGRAAFATRWQHEFTRLAGPKTSAAE